MNSGNYTPTTRYGYIIGLPADAPKEKCRVVRFKITGRYTGWPCEACKVGLRYMEGAVKHEYPGEYVASARYKLWHAACYPPAVNKEWNRLRKKFLKSGWK